MFRVIAVVIVTIVLGTFAVFVFIGMIAEMQTPAVPALRGTGPQDADEKVPDIPVFEVATITQFLLAATSGMMPGGEKTALPVFPQDEMKFFHSKYSEWATSPWSGLPSPGPFGNMPGTQSPPPLFRILNIMSGMQDIMQQAFDPKSRNENVERSFKSMKNLVWFGMAPVSHARLRSRGLDERDNIEETMAIIRQVIDVFQYLRQPAIQGQLRSTHNQVWAEIDVFQDAINGLRASRGEPAPEFSMTKLWQEYIRCHFDFMEKQARAWVFKQIKELYEAFKSHFVTVMQSGRQINATQATIKIDHWDMMILNKLLDLLVDADIYLRQPTEGFISTLGIRRELANVDSPEKDRSDIYAKLEEKRTGTLRDVLDQVISHRIDARTQDARVHNIPMPDFMTAPNKMVDREFGHKTVSYEVENPQELRKESWVRELSENSFERFGLVIYRLSYGETEEDWKSFTDKLDIGLSSGWDGMIGAEEMRRKQFLHWIDGRKEKIPEGDISAARTHFKEFIESPSFPTGISKNTCLSITPGSVKSFADTRAGDRKGDYRGFVHAIDPSFDPAKSNKLGFDGSFKIIDQLVWTDLYVRNCRLGTQTLGDYWALSVPHPWGLYVGSTTAVRRRAWREMRGGIGIFLKGLFTRGRA